MIQEDKTESSLSSGTNQVFITRPNTIGKPQLRILGHYHFRRLIPFPDFSYRGSDYYSTKESREVTFIHLQ